MEVKVTQSNTADFDFEAEGQRQHKSAQQTGSTFRECRIGRISSISKKERKKSL